jgi:hypothetical protein
MKRLPAGARIKPKSLELGEKLIIDLQPYTHGKQYRRRVRWLIASHDSGGKRDVQAMTTGNLTEPFHGFSVVFRPRRRHSARSVRITRQRDGCLDVTLARGLESNLSRLHD